MRKQYDELEIEIINLNKIDVITASGDNWEQDPWENFEY